MRMVPSQKHGRPAIVIRGLDRHLFGEFGQMPPIGRTSDAHGFLQSGIVTDDTDSKRHTLAFLKCGHDRESWANRRFGLVSGGVLGKVQTFHL
jgi:hypothetical protein